MTLANTVATVKWFNSKKGFGFFAVTDPESGVMQPDAFVHVSWLEAQGFLPADMVERTPAVIHYGTNRAGKVVALAVHSIGEKKATAPSTAAISTPKGDVKKAQMRVVDRGNGWVIKKDHVKTLYILEQDGEEPQQFGFLAQARDAVGKVIEPPKGKGYGVATNDPKVSQAMRGSSTGGGKKKAA